MSFILKQECIIYGIDLKAGKVHIIKCILGNIDLLHYVNAS